MALNPHQKNKVDLSKLSPEELTLLQRYGKLPNGNLPLQNKFKERKYFDSGDYALSKAGKSDAGLVGGLGREHPSPESIPHLSQQQSQGGALGTSPHGSLAGGLPTLHPTASHGQGGSAGSPVKEPSVLQRGISVDDGDAVDGTAAPGELGPKTDLEKSAESQGVPIQK